MTLRICLRSATLALLLGVAAAAPAQPGGPSADSPPAGLYTPETDALFQQPYVDIDEWRDAPVRHRYVHGGFKGTALKFSYYLPPKEKYRGRFFQYVTPVPDSETLSQGKTGEEDKIGFAIASGAYFVETNGGGSGATAGPAFRTDPTIGGFRANAAAAAYSRVVARRMYGGARPYGYIFGGSGGAYRTLGSIESTRGVWDGAVPYVVGSAVASPNNFTVRMHAMRVLRDKFPQIVDAMDAGGSGNPYAGLTAEEAAALREATRMGFPPQSWFAWKTMGVHAFTAIYAGVVAADPSYFTDFWTRPGYLGFDAPESLKRARLQFKTTVKAPLSAEQAEAHGVPEARIAGTARGTADLAWQAQVNDGSPRPAAIRLAATPPDVGFIGGDLMILSGAAKGKRLALRSLTGDTVSLGVVDVATLAQVKPGDEVQVDNSNFLAAQTYHRHQIPGAQYPVWNQFLGADGKPLYPQRPMLLGPMFTRGAAGTVPTGKFEGKMIVVESLWDREAWPWGADWYRQRVTEHLGAATDDHLRVWMTDRALHGDSSIQEYPARTVSYLGVLQQALRDLAAWVEKGVPPVASTAYRVEDGQVIVPPAAVARKGIQPTVQVTVGGGKKIVVKPGQAVSLSAVAEAPPGAGRIVSAEWDFEGNGNFSGKAALVTPRAKLTMTASHIFAKPGTYFPTLRVASERNGDRTTPFAVIPNLDRVRVVVEP